MDKDKQELIDYAYASKVAGERAFRKIQGLSKEISKEAKEFPIQFREGIYDSEQDLIEVLTFYHMFYPDILEIWDDFSRFMRFYNRLESKVEERRKND